MPSSARVQVDIYKRCLTTSQVHSSSRSLYVAKTRKHQWLKEVLVASLRGNQGEKWLVRGRVTLCCTKWMVPERAHKHRDSLLVETLLRRERLLSRCRWRFDSQLFSFKTYQVVSCPLSCDLTIWICMQGGTVLSGVSLKIPTCRFSSYIAENLQFPKYGEKCWKTAASRWVCWHLYSTTGSINKSFCPREDERLQTVF